MFEYIFVKERAADWQEAIRMAAKPLLDKEMITENYINAMIESLNKTGFYIVIADGVAMPHARPQDGVMKTGLSLMKLNETVMFGDNPIFMVLVLAAADNEAHIDSLTKIAGFLDNEERLKTLKSITDEEKFREFVLKNI